MSDVNAVGNSVCPYCGEAIKTTAVKCRHCGTIIISQEWRQFAQSYYQMGRAQREAEWAKMTPDQQAMLPAVLELLGYMQERKPTQQQRSSWAWVLIIAGGIIAAIALMSLG